MAGAPKFGECTNPCRRSRLVSDPDDFGGSPRIRIDVHIVRIRINRRSKREGTYMVTGLL